MQYSNGIRTQCHVYQYSSLYPVLFLQSLYVPFNSKNFSFTCICMAGADQYRHSSSKRVNVNFVDKSLALNETCSDTKFHVYWCHGY